MIYWTAIVMGLVANLHCIGMCGPISLAVPIKQNSTQARLKSVFAYNAGRVLMYGAIGAVFGLFGEGIALAGMQQMASIVMGVMILLIAFIPRVARFFGPANASAFSSFTALKSSFAKLLKKRSYSAIFGIGVLNALLPCGMVYLALVGAVASGEVMKGALFMVVFGIGTLPVMVALPLFGQLISPSIRAKFRKVLPVVTLCFGLLLIARGSNLGIPYISPEVVSTSVGSNLECH